MKFKVGDRVRYLAVLLASDITWKNKEGVIVSYNEDDRYNVQGPGLYAGSCREGNLELVRPLSEFEQSVADYIAEAKAELGL